MHGQAWTDPKISFMTFVIMALMLAQMGACTAGPSEWPQFRADSSNTGTSEGVAPMIGEAIWTRSTGASIISSPAVADGRLYIGDSNGKVWAFDAETGEDLWSFEAEGAIGSSPTFFKGVVYIGSDDKMLYALNASDGRQVWNFTTGGTVKSSVSVLEVAEGGEEALLIFGSYDNRLYALDLHGGQVWNYTARSFVHGKPAIGDNLTFTCSCDNNVYAVNVITGERAWNTSINDYSGVSPSVVNGTLFTAGRGGKVYAINISDGEVLWENDLKGTTEASPAVGHGLVFSGSTNGEISALDIDDGERAWVFRTPGKRSILSSPALVGGVLFFGDLGGVLHALRAKDGGPVWNFTADDGIQSSPAVAYGKVYFGTNSGTIYALGDTKPMARIVHPEDWQKVNGTVEMTIEAFGGNLSTVEVDIDDGGWMAAQAGPDGRTWTYSLNTKKLNNGEHKVSAKVTNATGEGVDSIYIIVKNKKGDGGRGFIPGPTTAVTMLAMITVTLVSFKRWR